MSFPPPDDSNEEDSFAYDDNPLKFVLLDRHPVIFTVAGIRYFKHKFHSVGIDISKIESIDDFHSARRDWNLLAAQSFADHISDLSKKSNTPSEHRVLAAALEQGMESAQLEADRLRRFGSVGLKAVKKCVNDD